MAFSSHDFNEVIRYPFLDDQWFSKLCLQGAVLFLLSMFFIGIPFMAGWNIALIKAGIDGKKQLPGWDQWGEYWRLGWRAFAVGIVYAVPIIAACLFLFVPAIILFIVAEESSQLEAVAVIGVLLMGIGVMFVMAYSLALYIVQPAYLTALAVGLPVRTAINIKIMWRYIQPNIAAIIITLGVAYLAGMMASVGMFIFFIGYFFTFPYAVAVTGYAYGIVYRNSTVKFS